MFMPMMPPIPNPFVDKSDTPDPRVEKELMTTDESITPEVVQMPVKKPKTVLEYQVSPYDYYVKDYFLAKSLLYVLGYKDDSILFHVAVDEAALKFKIQRVEIIKHVQAIELLNP